MWKWLSGCAVVIVVVIACASWWGLQKYKTFTAGGGIATVTIAASPARVFASLASADSFGTWQMGLRAPAHHGLLVVGDTLPFAPDSTAANEGGATNGVTTIRTARGLGMSVNGRQATWVVNEVNPGVALTLEMRGDNGQHMGSQRDSLVAVGDSTRVVATTEISVMDSLIANGKGHSSNMLDAGSKLIVSALRATHQLELERLKARIEGKPRTPDHH